VIVLGRAVLGPVFIGRHLIEQAQQVNQRPIAIGLFDGRIDRDFQNMTNRQINWSFRNEDLAIESSFDGVHGISRAI
jgi:hypothetical protein